MESLTYPRVRPGEQTALLRSTVWNTAKYSFATDTLNILRTVIFRKHFSQIFHIPLDGIFPQIFNT